MEVRNCKYNQHGGIDCEIDHPKFGWIPFTADENDVEEFGKEIFQQAQKGVLGPITPQRQPPQEEIDNELARKIRQKRNQLLHNCDWSQLEDTPQKFKMAYQPYRQALRDVPQQVGFPMEIEWPDEPTMDDRMAIKED